MIIQYSPDKRDNPTGSSSPTKGIIAGGHNSGNTILTSIDYITLATLGDASNFGNLIKKRLEATSCGNGVNGLIGGGDTGSVNGNGPYLSSIEYIKYATNSDAGSFADLSILRSQLASLSNKTNGLFCGGFNGSEMNVIDYVNFSTFSNAVDFGNLLNPLDSLSGTSNCHGGL